MSLKDADALTPDLHITKLVESLSPSSVKTTRVIVMAPQYLKDLNKLISSTPKSVFNTYFQWKAIQAFYSYVEADAITPYKRFVNELQGKVSRSSTLTVRQMETRLTHLRTPSLALKDGEFV